jgi:hypothetical protein
MTNSLRREFKVKKELSMQSQFRSYDDYEVGDIVVGKVVGTTLDRYKKYNIVIKVLSCQFKKEKPSKYEGKNLTMNNTGGINKVLKDASMLDDSGKLSDEYLGTILQFEYQGKAKLNDKHTYAGKEAHVIKVDIVEEDDGSPNGDVEL